MNRRQFVTTAAGSIVLGAFSATTAVAGEAPARAPSRIKAIAFDAFPIFDPRPVFALVERLYPGQGVELSNEWRIRQFEYTWLRVAAQRYADFWQVTPEALEFATDKLNLKL